MHITEIRRIFATRDKRQIEMMARKILTQGRSHAYMHELRQYANEFNDLLSITAPADKEYLALVYILAEHLKELNRGACACSIIYKPMYNSPERLGGILEILHEKFIAEDYCIYMRSRCLACRNEYESKNYESGFGQKVIWSEYKPCTS
jgi:hypothetical protein